MLPGVISFWQLIYRWKKWGTEKLSNFLKVTQRRIFMPARSRYWDNYWSLCAGVMALHLWALTLLVPVDTNTRLLPWKLDFFHREMELKHLVVDETSGVVYLGADQQCRPAAAARSSGEKLIKCGSIFKDSCALSALSSLWTHFCTLINLASEAQILLCNCP